MRNYLAVPILFLFSFFVSGQNFQDNMVIKSKVYDITAVLKSPNDLKVTIKENGTETKQEFSLGELKLGPFTKLFSQKVITLLGSSITQAEASKIADKAFYNITFSFLQQSIDQAPPAGTIQVGDTIPLWLEYDEKEFKYICGKDTTKTCEKKEIYKYLVKIKAKEVSGNGLMSLPLKDTLDLKYKAKYQAATLKISDVSIEFYEGYIENISVDGKILLKNPDDAPAVLNAYHNKEYRFRSKATIGFQTDNNYEKLSVMRLFDPFDDNISLGMYLSSAIQYKPNKALLRKDYSPANGVVDLKNGDTEILRKSPLSKTFEVKVFSDFLGFDQDSPNGLVQSELSYRFNFNNRRMQSSPKLTWLLEGYGAFQYIRFHGGITKIEENEQFLVPKEANSIIGESPNQEISRLLTTDPIELLRRQNWNLGLDVNLFYAEDSDLKYHLYVDLGYRYGRTRVRDSLVEINEMGEIKKTEKFKDFSIGYNTYFYQGHIDFLPNENFGVSMLYRKSYVTPAFNQLELETFDRFGEVEKPFKRWYNTFELLGRTRLGNAGNLFVRYRFNYQSKNVENNFHQLQVGYSFFLFKRVKSSSQNKPIVNSID